MLVLQRPLRNYYSKVGKNILQTMKKHCQERGLGLAASELKHRRPRTIFFTAEDVDQAAEADVIWQMHPISHEDAVPCKVSAKTLETGCAQLFGTPNKIIKQRVFAALQPAEHRLFKDPEPGVMEMI